jgi:putative Mg2+ transporter-C (MgtC) family protein
MIDVVEILLLKRLLLAVFLGAIIGFERQQAHKVAGLRTHIFVCLSTALLALIAQFGIANATAESTARIIADALIGIGFIGGGAILRHDTQVSGTTTAASIWTVAAVGIAVGLGFTFAAILVTLIAYLTLSVLWRLELRISGKTK